MGLNLAAGEAPSKQPATRKHRRCHWAIAITVVLVFFSLTFESKELDRYKPDLSISFSAKARNATIADNNTVNETIPTADNNTTASSEEPSLTLLVQLSGEFGNNMFKIIRGWGVARLLKRDFGWTTRLVFAQQRRGKNVMNKARYTAKQLRRCFLKPTEFKSEGVFGLGNKLLDEGYFTPITEIPGTDFALNGPHQTIQDLQANLRILHDYLSDHPELFESTNTTITENGSIVPRLMVPIHSLVIYPIVNEFYDDLGKFFVFDQEKCCGETLKDPPGTDETVLHLRNFATEIRKERIRVQYGFTELAPDRLAAEVLGHLQQGDKIALTGRNLKSESQNNRTQAHALVSALQQKNLTLRFSPGTDPMEDFCFLTRSQKELLGTPASTYVELAAYLAGPSLELTRLYQYVPKNSPHGYSLEVFRKTVGDHWNHPELRSRIRFEQYFDDEK